MPGRETTPKTSRRDPTGQRILASLSPTPNPRVDRLARIVRWVLIGLWVTLPATAGPAFEAGFGIQRATVLHTATAGLWTGWIVTAIALLVPRVETLTITRILTPMPFAVLVWLAWITRSTPTISPDTPAGGPTISPAALAMGLSASTAVAAIALTAWIGHAFVNGSAYGDERRFLLRPPTVLLLAPIPLAWLACSVVPCAAVLLLADQRWGPGGALLAAAIPLTAIGVRSLHAQHRRWIVFVPAGIVVHDYASLIDSLLVQKRFVRAVEPVTPEVLGASETLDLTVGAAGLNVVVAFSESVTITPRPAQRPGTGVVAESVEAQAIVVCPSRPGSLVTAWRIRR